MAVQDGYGKSSGSESLVFAYDLKDTVNSFRGEPATNSQNADISSMTQVGFDSWSCYDGSPPYHTWGTNQSKTFVTIPGPFGTSVNAMLYHNFNGGFYGPTDWGAVPNGTITAGRTYTVQGWVRAADSSSIGKTVTPYTYYSHSGGAYSAGTNYTLTDQWQLVSHTHTVQYNASGDGVMYFFTQNSGEVKMYLTMTGVFLDESHAVPWIIGGSTRSNTQGLLDLTGNNTIDLSNVSFNSNAKIVFDETNDYINVGDTLQTDFGIGNFSVECVVYIDPNITVNTGHFKGIVVKKGASGANAGFGIYYNTGYSRFLWSTADGSSSVERFTVNTWGGLVGKYAHVVMVRDSSATNQGHFYINGVYESITSGGSLMNVNSDFNLTIGASSTLFGNYFFNGDIPIVKIYNRALTPTEITNNYLKYKRQYGLT